MNKLALSERIRLILRIFIILGFLSTMLLGVLIVKRVVPFVLCWLAAFQFILYLVLILVLKRYVYKPADDVRRLYQRFVDDQAYEELFDSEYMLLPQWNEVMCKFKRLLNKQDAIKMSKKQAEYLALQNQINPHFLYNTLEAIRGDAICAGIDNIAETTEALSIFFRYSITGVDKLVTLEEEIDNVENYFKIQYYRFGAKLKLGIIYPEAEDITQYEIPKLTIQPFVENAIYHGIEKKVQGGAVKVKLETTARKILITISDDGVGMSEEMVEDINDYLEKVVVNHVEEGRKQMGGIAMKNVNSRIKLLFGEEYGIHVYSTAGIGTDIRIILPKVKRGQYEG